MKSALKQNKTMYGAAMLDQHSESQDTNEDGKTLV